MEPARSPRRASRKTLRLKSAYAPQVLPPRSTRLPRLIAAAVFVAGAMTLGSAAFASLRGSFRILSVIVPLTVRSNATSLAALAGLGLLVISGGLARRQRSAWWIALVLLWIAGVSHVLKDLDVVTAGVDLGMAAVLISARREFDAHPGPGSLRRGLTALLAAALAVWLFSWIAIVAHADGFVPHPSVGLAAVDALRGVVGLPLGLRAINPDLWIPGVLPILGVAVLVFGFASVFRPVVEARADPADLARTRELVRRYGSDSLAYFSLREDKRHFVHGEAVVSYRYLWNLGLVAGDPVGDPAAVGEAIAAFVHHARSMGWGVAVLAGGAELAPVYAELGLRSFYLGDEAVIDVRRFSLEGRRIRKVRQSCHRIERLGYRLEFLSDADVTPDLRDALDAVSRSWRGRAPERGFTMALGREPSADDPDCLTVVARDAEGRAQGSLHLVPCGGDHPGFSLDRMRRRPDTPNGLTEWMVAMTALELQRRGAARFSLNFSLLGGLFREEGSLPLFYRVQLALARRLNPFFQIESLQRFNEKFDPDWVPRYVYHEALGSLPRVALAFMEAEAFTRIPIIGSEGSLRRRRDRRAVVAKAV